jgi:hypothetical protein
MSGRCYLNIWPWWWWILPVSCQFVTRNSQLSGLISGITICSIICPIILPIIIAESPFFPSITCPIVLNVTCLTEDIQNNSLIHCMSTWNNSISSNNVSIFISHQHGLEKNKQTIYKIESPWDSNQPLRLQKLLLSVNDEYVISLILIEIYASILRWKISMLPFI